MASEDGDLTRVRSFADLAREYCDLATDSATHPVDPRDLARLVAAIVSAAFDLPDLDEDTPEPSAELQHERVQARFESLRSITYAEVFDPFEDPPAPPVAGSLLDDLQDLYADLKSGMVLYDAGYLRGAAWHWRFHFTIHWGEHGTSAIRALYWHIRHSQ